MFVTYVNSASTRVFDLVCGSLCRTFGQKPFTFFSLGLEALPALGGYTMDPNGAPAEGYGTPGAEQYGSGGYLRQKIFADREAS